MSNIKLSVTACACKISIWPTKQLEGVCIRHVLFHQRPMIQSNLLKDYYNMCKRFESARYFLDISNMIMVHQWWKNSLRLYIAPTLACIVQDFISCGNTTRLEKYPLNTSVQETWRREIMIMQPDISIPCYISITSFCCQIIEHVINSAVISQLKNNIPVFFCMLQHGFS